MFHEHQSVIILKLYNLEHDGAGRIVKLIHNGTDKGQYLVDVNVGYIVVPEERIVCAVKYWKDKNGR